MLWLFVTDLFYALIGHLCLNAFIQSQKVNDLDAHRSGLLTIANISVIEQKIQLLKDIAVASAKIEIIGSYDDVLADGTFRFTRVWSGLPDNSWQVITAHSSIVV